MTQQTPYYDDNFYVGDPPLETARTHTGNLQSTGTAGRSNVTAALTTPLLIVPALIGLIFV